MRFDMLRYLQLLLCTGMLSCASAERYDVVIVGGGASGTAAGLQAARMGARTLVIEEFDWLGGMLTSAGVSATDGNYRLRGGIWGEFRTELERHYGGDSVLKTGWVSNVMFEPSVGDRIFKQMAAREPNLTVWYRSALSGISRRAKGWSVTVKQGGRERRVEAAALIDATELGDVAKTLGVPYDVGMDSAAVTREDIAPARANDIIQDLTYVAVLKDYGHDVVMDRPEGYDPSLFACCCVNDLCISPKEPHRMWSRDMMITYGKLPNDKYMINWPIEGNDYYVDMIDMTPQERAEAIRQAKNHTLSFVYFLQHELGFRTLGLADDEFPTEDLLPFIPYHRESRRIHGVVRFTLNDITDPYAGTLYRTAVGVGDYPVDQHHTRYSGWGELPDLYFHPIPSYGFPLGIVIPAGYPGLLVAEKSVSVTNIVNGSSRLQPVVLQIG
ncbi:FAD-dependent oxidoreductase, partial [uncultured Alistipes sp.]